MQENLKKSPIKLITLREARENVRSNSTKPSGNASTLGGARNDLKNMKASKNSTPLRMSCILLEAPKSIRNTNMESNIHLIQKAYAVKEAFNVHSEPVASKEDSSPGRKGASLVERLGYKEEYRTGVLKKQKAEQRDSKKEVEWFIKRLEDIRCRLASK